MSVSQLNAPPIPKGVFEKPVPASPIAVPPYVPYVYGQVLMGGKGGIGYEVGKDLFILYLKVEKEDRDHCSFLTDVEEVWVAFEPKFGLKG